MNAVDHGEMYSPTGPKKKDTAGHYGFLIFKNKINVTTSISHIFAALVPLHQTVQCKPFYFYKIFSFQRLVYVFRQHFPIFSESQ